MWAALSKFLGLAGGSVVNQVGGVVNHAAVIGLVTYLLANIEKDINFRTSYGFLALVVLVAYGYMEVIRRSRSRSIDEQ